MAKKKGGAMTTYKKKKLISDLETLFLDGSIKHYSIRDLSRKFDIAKDTVSKYLEDIKLRLDPADIQYTQIKFKSLFEEAIRTCEYLVQTAMEEEREKDARESIKLLLETIKQQTDFMERFFIKDKVADKLNVQGEMNHNHQINVNISTFARERVQEVEAFEVKDYERIANNS